MRTIPWIENDSLDWERFLGLRTIPGIQYDSRDWVRFQGLRTFPPLNVSSLLPPWPGFWNFINWIWISWIQNFFLRHTSQSFFFYPITRLTWFSLYLSILSQSKFDCPILLLPNTENCQGGLPMGKRCQTRPLHYEHCFFETHHIISRNFKHIVLVNPRQQSLKSSGTVPLTQRNPVSRSNRIRTAAIKDSHFICILRKSTMPLNSWAEQREGLQGSPGGNRIRRNLVDIYLFDLLVYDLLLMLLSIVIVAISNRSCYCKCQCWLTLNLTSIRAFKHRQLRVSRHQKYTNRKLKHVTAWESNLSLPWYLLVQAHQFPLPAISKSKK